MFALALVLGWISAVPFPREPLSTHTFVSVRVTDRAGETLREPTGQAGGRAIWLGIGNVPQHLKNALVAAEDHRFWSHSGVDAWAAARAALDSLQSGRITSGASTLTMQVVRLVWPRQRSWIAKLSETIWAIRLERTLTKNEILEQYLNRAPYGNRLFGVEAAAQAYLGHSARELTVAEAAWLAGLPNAPTALNPWRHPDRATARQRYVVERMRRLGLLTNDEAVLASQPVRLVAPVAPRFLAPHAVDAALREVGAIGHHASFVELSIDLGVQRAVEDALRRSAGSLSGGGASGTAVVVLDNESAEILALVGSPDYFAAQGGKVNGATARRQPGSALKPFAYALALDRGLNLSTLLPDLPVSFPEGAHTFAPRNFDGRFRGPVRVRAALAASLNVPAVHVAKYLGTERLLASLRSMQLAPAEGTPERFGLGLVLGVGETRLVDLGAAYASLARGGAWRAPRLVRRVAGPQDEPLELGPPPSHRAFSAEAAFLVADALMDEAERALVFGTHASLGLPFPVALKTGTSGQARDLWAFGVTADRTVGVWVGNPDGRGLGDVVAAQVAQPILGQVLAALYRDSAPPEWTTPNGVARVAICSVSGGRATEACPRQRDEWRAAAHPEEQSCQVHRRIKVDARNGLLATSACPASHVEWRSFEVWPVELSGWARGEGRPAPPVEPSRLCAPP